MQRQSQCSRCRKRTIRREVSCFSCGGPVAPTTKWLTTRHHGLRIGAALAILATLAVGLSDRYLPAVADWYLELAVPYLSESSSGLTAPAVDELAFYACARSIVKQLDVEGAIATFPRPSDGSTRSLGDGRYRVDSVFQESREGGGNVLRSFSCTVRADGPRWAIEDVRMQGYRLARSGG